MFPLKDSYTPGSARSKERMKNDGDQPRLHPIAQSNVELGMLQYLVHAHASLGIISQTSNKAHNISALLMMSGAKD